MPENLFKEDNSSDEANSQEVKKDFQGLLGSVRKFMTELLEIRSNTDAATTKESIILDIPFKGHTSWILICSIFIASIGLNANSTAVVIGAMLISPLMGPILGMGLSLAINDVETLRKSLKNFLVMVVLSVVTAFLFFYTFPIQDESSELLARTKPDIRDVLIAFFGGLALVIARAKKGTIASVIFGVAIATALMPPLCTVGFGLAIGNWWYALGAMYLFIINTIFIALATFLVIKYLRFPMVRYANSRRRRRIARIASAIGLLVMLPAGYTFYMAFNESLFKKQAQEFLSETIEIYEFARNGRYLDNLTKIEYDYQNGSLVEIVCMGSEEIPENILNSWRRKKQDYSRLKDAEFSVVQGGKDDSEEKFNYVSELYEAKKAELLTREERIRFLEEEVVRLSENVGKQIPFQEVVAEAKEINQNLAGLSFAYQLQSDFNKMDTIPIFEAKWKGSLRKNEKVKQSENLLKWLKVRLKDSTIVLRQE
ncbi:TIGR00341 family protein [Croceivirga thetidis]|uniref:TIGR00341 family protein n=1 Tax=Croceivirga thetidis TaxID=2721623 RepID=A0ABX1GTP1_9FLAO|nr:TIGR00341 family protein [Croceivirga thetidis]NKI33286.1 TIGR00341 family protein [Croceivirga thetidis]